MNHELYLRKILLVCTVIDDSIWHLGDDLIKFHVHWYGLHCKAFLEIQLKYLYQSTCKLLHCLGRRKLHHHKPNAPSMCNYTRQPVHNHTLVVSVMNL